MLDIFNEKGSAVQPAPNTVEQNQEQGAILTVAKGGGLTFVALVAARVINYAFTAALIWGLGAESFGLFTLAFAIIGLVTVIANLGLTQGIVRYGAIYAHAEGRAGIRKATMAALRITIPLSIIVTMALLLTSDRIAESIFRKPELTVFIQAMALSIPFMALMNLLLAATRALKVMKYSVIVWVVQPATALLFATSLLILGGGVRAVALSFSLSFVVGASLALFYFWRQIASVKKDTKPFPSKEMIKFSLPLTLNSWVHFANERTEVFFLGILPGAVDVGIYNLAWRIAGLETVLVQSLNGILAPFSSDLSHRKEISQLESLYKTTAKWSFTGALLLFLVFALFAGTILGFFDPAFAAGSSVLIALGIAQLINAATGPCGTLLIMSGRSDLSLLNMFTLFALSISLDWLLIPEFGLIGAAIAGALALVLVNLMRLVEVWLTLRIHPFRWSFLKPVLAGLVSTGVIIALKTYVNITSPLMDIAYMFLMGLIYVATIYLLRVDAEDKLVLDAVRHRIPKLKQAKVKSIEDQNSRIFTRKVEDHNE